MDFDRLCEVELDPVAAGAENGLHGRKDERVEYQCGHVLRSLEQAADAICAAAVEIAFTKGRRGADGVEIPCECMDTRDPLAANYAIALAAQPLDEPAWQTGSGVAKRCVEDKGWVVLDAFGWRVIF